MSDLGKAAMPKIMIENCPGIVIYGWDTFIDDVEAVTVQLRTDPNVIIECLERISALRCHPFVQDWFCGGSGPLATLQEPLRLGDVERAIKEAEIKADTVAAKRAHTAIRRAEFNYRRPELILQMIEAGILYTCAQNGCNERQELTVDHKVPLSRGGTDQISNLQFLCRQHNSLKRDQ